MPIHLLWKTHTQFFQRSSEKWKKSSALDYLKCKHYRHGLWNISFFFFNIPKTGYLPAWYAITHCESFHPKSPIHVSSSIFIFSEEEKMNAKRLDYARCKINKNKTIQSMIQAVIINFAPLFKLSIPAFCFVAISFYSILSYTHTPQQFDSKAEI